MVRGEHVKSVNTKEAILATMCLPSGVSCSTFWGWLASTKNLCFRCCCFTQMHFFSDASARLALCWSSPWRKISTLARAYVLTGNLKDSGYASEKGTTWGLYSSVWGHQISHRQEGGRNGLANMNLSGALLLNLSAGKQKPSKSKSICDCQKDLLNPIMF